MKRVCISLLTALVLVTLAEFGESQNGIVLSPPTNQTIALGSSDNITYYCNVTRDRVALWDFGGAQIRPGSDFADSVLGDGLIIEPGATISMARMVVTQRAREVVFPNRDLGLRCAAVVGGSVDIEFGGTVYVRTFMTPTMPVALEFNPVPSDLSRLVLTWDQPDNTLMDAGDPVVTTYTVTVSGPTFNFTNTTTDTRYEIVDSLDEDCASHTFTVFASNDAGDGPSVMLDVTIPISPGIVMLNSSLSVSRIALSGSTPAVDVTFSPATTCNDTSFPITRYMVTLTRGNLSDSAMVPVSDARVAGQNPITLPVPTSILELDQDYEVTVSACISVTCRGSSPVPFNTVDVQSASITFFEDNVFLECTFTDTIAGQGCVFILTPVSGDPEMLAVSAGAGSLCGQTMNMQNGYTSFEAVDWNSDGTPGMVTVNVTVNPGPEITSVAEYTSTTGCVPPSTGLSPGAIAGIVIGVIAGVLIILAVAIVIAVVVYIQRTKRLPKINLHDDEKLSVDFEKEWLMDDAIKKSRSVRKNSKVTFSKQKSGAAEEETEEPDASIVESAGPPPLASPVKTEASITTQPSLTDPEPAFTLHIDDTKKRAHLQLNRALIRRVVKAQRMHTLEKKRKAATSIPTDSIRQVLLPLHSLIHVRGEGEGDEDHQDGETITL